MCTDENKSKAKIRLETMIAAFHAGKLTSLNKDPENISEYVNYDHLSEDTVYAYKIDEE